MGDVRQLLARVTAKSTAYEVHGGSGRGGLTSSDVAAGLAQIRSPAAAGLVMAKWCDDPSGLPETHATAIATGATLAARHGRKKVDQDVLARLAAVAVQEVLSANVCRTCSGTRSVITESSIGPCPDCYATGFRLPGGDTVGPMIGVSKEAYRLRWRAIHYDLVVYLHSLENEALRRLAVFFRP